MNFFKLIGHNWRLLNQLNDNCLHLEYQILVLANASQTLNIFDQVIVVVLVIQWCSTLNGDFVAWTIAIRFNLSAQFELERFEVLQLKECI